MVAGGLLALLIPIYRFQIWLFAVTSYYWTTIATMANIQHQNLPTSPRDSINNLATMAIPSTSVTTLATIPLRIVFHWQVRQLQQQYIHHFYPSRYPTRILSLTISTKITTTFIPRRPVANNLMAIPSSSIGPILQVDGTPVAGHQRHADRRRRRWRCHSAWWRHVRVRV